VTRSGGRSGGGNEAGDGGVICPPGVASSRTLTLFAFPLRTADASVPGLVGRIAFSAVEARIRLAQPCKSFRRNMHASFRLQTRAFAKVGGPGTGLRSDPWPHKY